ncbi:hypothetical protein ACFOHS_22845 [Jhaorihella thermophila]
MALVEAFDGDLKHPTAISEKAWAGAGQGIGARSRLRRSCPRAAAAAARTDGGRRDADSGFGAQAAGSGGGEKADAGAAGQPKAERPATDAVSDVAREHVAPGLTVSFYPSRGKIELSGPKVDEGLLADLRDWLAARAG